MLNRPNRPVGQGPFILDIIHLNKYFAEEFKQYGIESGLPDKDENQAVAGTIYLYPDRTYFFRDLKGVMHTGSLKESNDLSDWPNCLQNEETRGRISKEVGYAQFKPERSQFKTEEEFKFALANQSDHGISWGAVLSRKNDRLNLIFEKLVTPSAIKQYAIENIQYLEDLYYLLSKENEFTESSFRNIAKFLYDDVYSNIINLGAPEVNDMKKARKNNFFAEAFDASIIVIENATTNDVIRQATGWDNIDLLNDHADADFFIGRRLQTVYRVLYLPLITAIKNSSALEEKEMVEKGLLSTIDIPIITDKILQKQWNVFHAFYDDYKKVYEISGQNRAYKDGSDLSDFDQCLIDLKRALEVFCISSLKMTAKNLGFFGGELAQKDIGLVIVCYNLLVKKYNELSSLDQVDQVDQKMRHNIMQEAKKMFEYFFFSRDDESIIAVIPDLPDITNDVTAGETPDATFNDAADNTQKGLSKKRPSLDESNGAIKNLSKKRGSATPKTNLSMNFFQPEDVAPVGTQGVAPGNPEEKGDRPRR